MSARRETGRARKAVKGVANGRLKLRFSTSSWVTPDNHNSPIVFAGFLYVNFVRRKGAI